MRGAIWGGLVVCLGFVGGVLGDRVLTNAPDWVWPALAAFGASLGVVILLASEPVASHLTASRGQFRMATVFVFLVCGAAGAIAWNVMARIESTSEPPLYVTSVEVFPPSTVGQPVMTRVHVFSKRSGNVIRARGGALIFPVWSAEDERRRAEIESNEVWKPLIESRGMEDPEAITLPEGEYSLDLFPFILAHHHVGGLQDGTAAVYVFGQFDYGKGALDYCFRWRPDGSVKPCLAHNGPAVVRIL